MRGRIFALRPHSCLTAGFSALAESWRLKILMVFSFLIVHANGLIGGRNRTLLMNSFYQNFGDFSEGYCGTDYSLFI